MRLGVPTAVVTLGVLLAAAPSSVASGVYIPSQSHVTVRTAGGKCSVTENGPVFPYNNAGWRMTYGGRLNCAGGIDRKTLSLYAQVLSQDRTRWFTIFGSGLVQGPAQVDPLRLSTTRTAHLGHAYRIVAVGHLTLPGGKTFVATAHSKPWAP